MKKIFLLAVAVMAFTFTQVSAQSYKTGLGLGLDFGDGATYVGPSIKHFFNANNALQGDILFASGSTMIGAYYQYHGDFQGASGLKWFAGVGPGFDLYDGGSTFFIRPMTGLDYKITGAPIALSFDWRPALLIGDNNTRFEPARFGLGFRFTLN